ncbi:MAG: TIGR02302 family protein [Magnetovibrionaceae bacterium]
MTDPRRGRYHLLVALARLALLWERLWPRLWPAVSLAAVFVSLALLDVLPLLPAWAHGTLLAAFLLAIGAGLYHAVSGVKKPDTDEARHRLETDSGLKHRPLTTLDDIPIAGTAQGASAGLWNLHLERVAKTVKSLRLGWPRPRAWAHDPWSLRVLAILFLYVGIAAGWSNPTERLARAFVPTDPVEPRAAFQADLWLTPPSYMRKAPVRLAFPLGPDAPALESPIIVPKGSQVLAQASGALEPPTLETGATVLAFERLGAGADGFRLEATLEEGDQLTLVADEQAYASWPILLQSDSPPTIEFIQAPQRTPRSHWRVSFEAADDFGIQAVHFVAALTSSGADQEPIRRKVAISRSEAGQGGALWQSGATFDFTEHPWAGLPVRVWLEAEDGAGQIGKSGEIETVLPERIFNHPVARALAEIRKALNVPTDKVKQEATDQLAELMSAPKRFFDDTTVFLGMGVARSRLAHDKGEGAVASVRDLLWNLAIRIEDGGLSIAEQDLARAQEALSDALERGASQQEVEQLMDQLQEALNTYMQALMEQLERAGMMDAPFNPEDMETMQSNDLQRFLDEARELSRLGNTEQAQSMLEQLRDMLDRLREGALPGEEQREQMARGRELMDELRGVTQNQRQLMDDSFKEAQQQRNRPEQRGFRNRDVRRGELPPPGERPLGNRQQSQQQQQRSGQQQGAMQGRQQGQQQDRQQGDQSGGRQPGGEQGGSEGEQSAEARQRGLRDRLNRLMEDMNKFLGGMPEGLAEAESAMEQAEQALAEGNLPGAVDAQGRALEALQGAAEQAGNEMAQQMGQQGGGMFGMQSGNRPGQQGRDPFNRPGPGGLAGQDGVKVPGSAERRRAHDILEELRRRAGDGFRPEVERLYIERLLDLF